MPFDSRPAPATNRQHGRTRDVRLEISGLRKRYGSATYALDGVSVSFGVGLTGLVGPNGAGKSTLIRCIAGLQNWDEGSISVSAPEDGRRCQQTVGYMAESVAFPRELRVDSYLRFVCDAKGVGRRWRDEVDEKVEITGLSDVAHRVVGTLSKGYRQRLGLAQAMIGDPPVLVLDEPVSSLDPINIVDVRRAIRQASLSACVLVSTHQLAEAKALCERVVLLDRGRVAFDGPIEELGRGSHQVFEIEILSADEPLRLFVAEGGVGQALRTLRPGEAYVLTLPVANEHELADRVASMTSRGFAVIGVRPAGDALEEAFAHAVANAKPEEPQP